MKEKVQIVLYNGDIEERELERTIAYCPICKKKWITHSFKEIEILIKQCTECFIKAINKMFDSLLRSE